MELQDYLRILRKRWISILAITLLAVVGAGAATLLMTPKYTATAQTFVSVRGTDNTSDLLQGSNFSQNQVKSYAQLVTSPLVLTPVIRQLGLDTTPSDLAKVISADSPLDTVLINITVTDPSPEQAAAIANATATSFALVIPTLEQVTTQGDSPVKITTVQQAAVPVSPSSPKKTLNLALGLLVGLALGIGYAVLRESLDTKVHGLPDVETVTDAPVLGMIPYDPDTPDHPLAAISSGRGESVRRLRTNLQFTNLDGRPRTIVVTSAVPAEGKTTTTVNLALALAEARARVIVVDADLRRPSISEYLGLEGSVGLTTVLIGRAALGEVVQRYGSSGLHVLPAGEIPPNPSEVLGSVAMAELLDALASSYDVVLLDSPPLLPVTDAAVLAKLCGGTLVVAGSGRLRRAQLADALTSLLTVGAHVLGVVLNRVPTKGGGYGYSYYAGYAPRQPAPSPGAHGLGSGAPARVVVPPSGAGAGGTGADGVVPVAGPAGDLAAGAAPAWTAAVPPAPGGAAGGPAVPASAPVGPGGSVRVVPADTPHPDPARPAWVGGMNGSGSGSNGSGSNGSGSNGHGYATTRLGEAAHRSADTSVSPASAVSTEVDRISVVPTEVDRPSVVEPVETTTAAMTPQHHNGHPAVTSDAVVSTSSTTEGVSTSSTTEGGDYIDVTTTAPQRPVIDDEDTPLFGMSWQRAGSGEPPVGSRRHRRF